MPLYDYRCKKGHLTESIRGTLNQDKILCSVCKGESKRVSVYREQGVVFKGEGFTRSVIPPASPKPPTTSDEKPDYAKEMLDDFAYENYEHDKDYRRDYGH